MPPRDDSQSQTQISGIINTIGRWGGKPAIYIMLTGGFVVGIGRYVGVPMAASLASYSENQAKAAASYAQSSMANQQTAADNARAAEANRYVSQALDRSLNQAMEINNMTLKIRDELRRSQ